MDAFYDIEINYTHLGIEKMVDSLIKHGSNVNLIDNGGWTPLNLACRGSGIFSFF